MMDDLPIVPDAPAPLPYDDSINPPMYRLQQALRPVGAQACMMYASLEHHVPCRAFRSIEERDRVCEEEAARIRAAVDAIDFDEIKAALDGYYEYIRELGERHRRPRRSLRSFVFFGKRNTFLWVSGWPLPGLHLLLDKTPENQV